MNVVEFSPPNLSSQSEPPTFSLRVASRADRKAFRRLLFVSGLRFHSQAALRAEITNGLHELWSPKVLTLQQPRLAAYWTALDAHQQGGETSFEHPDQSAMEELLERLPVAWPPLQEMLASNTRYQEESPKHLLCLLLMGWDGIDVPHRRADGMVPIETIDQIERALGKLEAQADQVPGGAFSGLALKAVSVGLDLTTAIDDEEASAC